MLVSVAVEGMYTCKTGHSGNEPFWVCYCYYRGYLHIQYWELRKQDFLFMLVLL